MPYIAQATIDELVRSHHALVAEVAALRADFRRHGVGGASDAQAALIEGAYRAMGDCVFLATELLAMALLPAHIDLQRLLASKGPRGVGCLLREAAGRTTEAGLVLRAVGGGGSAPVIWHVGFET